MWVKNGQNKIILQLKKKKIKRKHAGLHFRKYQLLGQGVRKDKFYVTVFLVRKKNKWLIGNNNNKKL